MGGKIRWAEDRISELTDKKYIKIKAYMHKKYRKGRRA